jgi:hypothetical protein
VSGKGRQKLPERPAYIDVALFAEISAAFDAWWEENRWPYALQSEKIASYIAFRDGYVAGKSTNQDDGK